MNETDRGGRVARVHNAAHVVLTHNHVMFEKDFDRMLAGGVCGAFVVLSVDGRMHAPQNVWLESLEHDTGLLASTLVGLDYVESLVQRPGSRVMIAREQGDIERAKHEGKVALVLGSEGVRFLEGRLEVLRAVYRLGFRYVAPMWFYDSAVGTAQDNNGPEGLTPWGREVIAEANRLGLVLDVNHFSERSLLEALELSRHPVLVSHSGARALNPAARQLLSDQAIKAVAAHNGIIGIMFQSFILKPGYEQASIEELVRQFVYCAELVGPEHLACGPDYLANDPRLWGGNNPTGESPGPFTWARGVEDATGLPSLTEALLAHGFSDDDVRKMLGDNVVRLFNRVRADATEVPVGEYPDVGGDGEIGLYTDGLTPV
jgi:membrane dipeptidase